MGKKKTEAIKVRKNDRKAKSETENQSGSS